MPQTVACRLLLVACCFFYCCSHAQAVSKRSKESFDESWQFHKGNIAMKRQIKAGGQGGLTDINVKLISSPDTVINYTDERSATVLYTKDWEEVNIPHDWGIEGSFIHDNSLGSQPAGNGYLPTGVGFYRKEFNIPETDRGRKISIELDGIFRNSTVWVNGNLLGNHQSGYTPSNYDLTDYLRYGNEGKNVILVKVDANEYEGWWYEGCGIYRHAWLVKTDRLHVDRFGTYITTPVVTGQKATVNIKTTLKNEYNEAKEILLVSKIVDKNGLVLDMRSSAVSIPPFGSIEIAQTGGIKNPLLWSPESPNLCKVLTTVSKGGLVVDHYETVFGTRTIEINTKGVFLNGKLYPVKGTCNHQDFAGLGVALPDKIIQYKLKLLKEAGSNAYRCSHHPPTPELLNMCDSMGLLVLDENRFLSSSEEGLKDLSAMLYRDRNHPSIFMWGMENEEWIQGTVAGARILKTMVETAHKIDPTRKVTAAMNHARNDGGYADVLDVVGYNYGDKGLAYVKDHEKYPRRVEFCTEGTSFVSTRGEYENNREKGYVSNMTKWEPGWAAWTTAPVVHLFPHWDWPGKEGKTVAVQCYTNCEEVELLLNGQTQGRKKAVPFEKLEWPLIYRPGKLKARGYRNGQMVTNDVVETTTTTTSLALNSDCSSLKADGCDVAVVKVEIRDSMGRVVPVADNQVIFSIDGPGKIIGTGNGNPSSHEPDKASQRMAFNGYCMVLVQSGKTQGDIHLKATSGQLKGADIIIKSR